MCLSRGCLDGQDRHNAQVITMSDVTAAAADARIDIPQLLANLAAGAGLAEHGTTYRRDARNDKREPLAAGGHTWI